MQLEFFDIPSPCIGMCESDDKGHCLGCMRSRDERQNWKDFSSNEKQKIIKRCVQRKKRKKNKHNKQHNTVLVQTPTTQEKEANRQPSLLDPPDKTNMSSSSELSSDLSSDLNLDFSDFEL